VPGSLILARLRIGEIYSLWLYRISSFVSRMITGAVESFNAKGFLALFSARAKLQRCRTRRRTRAATRSRSNRNLTAARRILEETPSTPAWLPGLRQARSLKDHPKSKSIADSIYVNAKREL
jgi:hypothetical protein